MEQTVCNNCNGLGYLTEQHFSCDGEWQGEEVIKCEKCNGNGWILK